MFDLLAVYGTLRQPLKPFKIGTDEVRGNLYSVYDQYPAAILDENSSNSFMVTIHRIPIDYFPKLDAYEGVDSGLYTRRRITTEFGPTWIYEFNDDVSDMERINSWR